MHLWCPAEPLLKGGAPLLGFPQTTGGWPAQQNQQGPTGHPGAAEHTAVARKGQPGTRGVLCLALLSVAVTHSPWSCSHGWAAVDGRCTCSQAPSKRAGETLRRSVQQLLGVSSGSPGTMALNALRPASVGLALPTPTVGAKCRKQAIPDCCRF